MSSAVTVKDSSIKPRSGLPALAEALGLEYRPNLGVVSPPRDLLLGDFTRIIGSWGKALLIVPLTEEDGEIVVAINDPLQVEAVDSLSRCYGKPIRLVVAEEEEIIRVINSVRTSLMSDRTSNLEMTDKNSQSDEISSPLGLS